MPLHKEMGRVSAAQAVCTVVIAIIGSATLIVPGGMIKVAAQDAWLSCIVAGAGALLTGLLWLQLVRQWPGRDLFEVVLAAGGRWLGGPIALLLLAWIALTLTGSTWIGADTILTMFLPETPRVVLIASLLIPAACAARSGPVVVARLCQLAFWAILAFLMVLGPLSVPEIELHRLTPLLANGIGPVWKGAGVVIGFMSENMVLVALLPLVKQPARPWRLLAAVTALSAGLVVLLDLWTVTMLGAKLPARYQYPVLLMAHVIGVGDIVERLDALMMAIWVAGVVAKGAFWYWLLCSGMARVLKVKDFRYLVWPSFLPLMAATMAWVESSMAYPDSLRAWTIIFTPLVNLAAPLLLLAATAVRRVQRHTASQ